MHAGDLRFILGLKLKALRLERGLGLKDLAARAGVSVSYLSEIEQGKKYPKPEKLVDLAGALGIAYDDLVSLRVRDDLGPLKAVFTSPLVREFPFALYGVEPERLFSALRDQPGKAGALLSALAEIGQLYDVGVEDFLLAALRSYQGLVGNHFADLERAADAVRAELALPDPGADPAATERALRDHLAARHSYRFDDAALDADPDLRDFRSVFVPGPTPTLYLNGRLSPVQRSFNLARELAYERFAMGERALTSTWLRVRSFDQLLGNLRASYFAGALLLPETAMADVFAAWTAAARWDDGLLLGPIRRLGVTPEMFFYRLTQLAGEHLGLRALFFMRVHYRPASDTVHLTKILNLTHAPLTRAMHLREHQCRRWVAPMLLRGHGADASADLVARAQRSRFFERDETYFGVAVARPLALRPDDRSGVSFGFLLDAATRARLPFTADAAVPDLDVNVTCERCPLSPDECHERAAPPARITDALAQARKAAALAALGVPDAA